MHLRLKTRVGASLTGVILAAGALAGCGSSSSSGGGKAPLNVGVAVGLTGYLSSDDVPFSQGIKLAAKTLNKAGGVDGHKVNLHVVDMQSSAATGVSELNNLLNKDGVGAVLGGSVSAATAAYAPVVTRAQVPVIAASVLPSDSKWLFSTLQPVSETNGADLGFIKSKLHLKRIAVISSETPYGEAAAKGMTSAAESRGLSVVSSQAVSDNATDLTPELQKVQRSGAQAIVDILTGPVHLVEAKSAASVGLKIPIVMGQDTLSIFKQSTAAYPKTYWTGLAAQIYPHNADPKIKAANVAFQPIDKRAYGSSSDIANAARGWDTMQILAKAVRASGAVTGESLRSALEKVQHSGTDSEYDYSPSDHTGQLKVKNPLGVGHYDGSTLKVVYSAS